MIQTYFTHKGNLRINRKLGNNILSISTEICHENSMLGITKWSNGPLKYGDTRVILYKFYDEKK